MLLRYFFPNSLERISELALPSITALFFAYSWIEVREELPFHWEFTTREVVDWASVLLLAISLPIILTHLGQFLPGTLAAEQTGLELAISTLFISPILSELLFRGVLFTAILPIAPRYPIGCASMVAFIEALTTLPALIGKNIPLMTITVQLLLVLLPSLIFGFQRVRKGTIVASLLLHVAYGAGTWAICQFFL